MSLAKYGSDRCEFIKAFLSDTDLSDRHNLDTRATVWTWGEVMYTGSLSVCVATVLPVGKIWFVGGNMCQICLQSTVQLFY